MLYGCGDVKYPKEATINQLLELTINYVSRTIKRAMLISKHGSMPVQSLYLLPLPSEAKKQEKLPGLAELCKKVPTTDYDLRFVPKET